MNKKIYEFRAEKAEIIQKMKVISESEKPDMALFRNYELEANNIDREILKSEQREESNKSIIANMNGELANQNNNKEGISLRTFIQDTINSGHSAKKVLSFRADPIASTTDAGIINKTIAGVDTLMTPGEVFLKNLGVTFYLNQNGKLKLPYVAESTANFCTEGTGDASTADLDPTSIELEARRISHSQKFTVEMLSQSDPKIFTSLVKNLENGIWKKVGQDIFDQIETDAASYITGQTGTDLEYTDICNQEASLGGYDLLKPAYVTTPDVRNYLKNKQRFTTTDSPVWNNDIVNGYNAYAFSGANDNTVYFGDYSKAVVASWGKTINMIVDPFTEAKKGNVIITLISLFDTGVTNPAAFTWLDDVSAGV